MVSHTPDHPWQMADRNRPQTNKQDRSLTMYSMSRGTHPLAHCSMTTLATYNWGAVGLGGACTEH